MAEMHVLPLSLCFRGHPADNSKIRQLTLYTEAPKFPLLTEVHQLYRFGGSMNLYIKKFMPGTAKTLQPLKGYLKRLAITPHLFRTPSSPPKSPSSPRCCWFSSPCSRVGHLLSSRLFRHPRGGRGGLVLQQQHGPS
jgi:hypothetical protein